MINKNIKNNFFSKYKTKNFIIYIHTRLKQKNSILAWSHIGDFKYNIPALIKKKI